ncbi:hypothetical protein F5ESL0236_06855 [Lactobacillus sp. ESL0236]|uniref:hypothetical protein n=1 Tax=unclassified Lactobacillus TaxID=2620435 RepID=UPI000EFB60B8|nr:MULTISPECIES: hypothetical protein [unclassified Lactobacillus]RMC38647.1 hypothetical protein F5ESL0237_06845 [Lactobacillus sp. ESL0237]RMC42992.1 hypothetical protein F5ESL0234_06850 [Lactobacillus sp. ESL0234]RMC43846.1 hypothetical protein F5ESL0236_06855 [Lactobacillus sp. ESL0236]
MKKTTIWTIVAAVVVVLGGSFFFVKQNSTNNQVEASYNQAITHGKKAVANKNYAEASNKFKQALNIKKTKQAAAYKSQADNMLVTIKYAQDGKYDQALKAINQVITKSNGYPVLTKQGEKLKSLVEDVEDDYKHEIKPIFATASQAEADKQYLKAIEQYQKVLNLPYIGDKYYQKYKNIAQAGIKKDKKAATNGKSAIQGYAAISGNGSSSNNHAKSNNAQNSIGATGNAGKTGEGSMGNHQVNGKTVAKNQIAQLRKRVGKLGYDAMSWSPQDLIDLYRSSKRANPNLITKRDVQKYLKP